MVPMITPFRMLWLIAGMHLAVVPVAPAQTPEATPTPPSRSGIWKAEMPAGDYLVSLSAITSISQHEYTVEGAGRITEVTVVALGSAIARFYVVEPLLPQTPGGVGQSTVNLLQEKIEEVAGRTGADQITQKVVKSYPAATHAHTIEYRLSNREVLSKLFASLERSWLNGRGETFKP